MLGRLTVTISAVLALITTAGARSWAYGPCDADAEKFCETDTHLETVKACLHKKTDQLSADCKAYVKSQEAEYQKTVKSWDLVRKACAAEITKSCQEVATKEEGKAKALQVCLMSEVKDLSAPCKQEINRHIKDHQPHIKEIP